MGFKQYSYNFKIVANGGGMVSKGLRAFYLSSYSKFGAGYNATKTTETLTIPRVVGMCFIFSFLLS